MSFTESWALEDGGTAVLLVTSPDFGAWVPKALQSQASFQKLEFHDVRFLPATCLRVSGGRAGRGCAVDLAAAAGGLAATGGPGRGVPVPKMHSLPNTKLMHSVLHAKVAQPPLNGTGTGVQIISYEPAELTKPPYSLPVRTESPMLGHKVGRRRALPACLPAMPTCGWHRRRPARPCWRQACSSRSARLGSRQDQPHAVAPSRGVQPQHPRPAPLPHCCSWTSS